MTLPSQTTTSDRFRHWRLNRLRPSRHRAPLLLATVTALLCAPSPAKAWIQFFDNRSSFIHALADGYYEDLSMFNNFPNYSGGDGFAYSVQATPVNTVIATQDDADDITPSDPSTGTSLVFTFQPGITAFGGYFYSNDTAGNFIPDPINISISTASSTYTTTQTPLNYRSFYGFISYGPGMLGGEDFTTAVVTSTNEWPAAGDVIVGLPVPGPLPLAGASSAFFWSRHLRRRLSLRHSPRPSLPPRLG